MGTGTVQSVQRVPCAGVHGYPQHAQSYAWRIEERRLSILYYTLLRLELTELSHHLGHFCKTD